MKTIKILLIALIEKWCCKHNWDEIKSFRNYTTTSLKYNMPVDTTFLYCCKKCGKFKKVRL